ncbi:SpoIIIAH-like family protein [Ammoniphilus sp. YIM 78166]|uniref:SpoIIIAH-like family protein n=1 Tax=Ammoniphilus sp. YIM 78166 TaxID=1644106 RepID=UPI0014317837|nr:SpoIIIAH-like family protein [Ammoniphilus sp. YIM 78166]
MVLKKQTVWLLSMLTIMVVLSAYYLVQGPIEQVPVASTNPPVQEGPELQVDSKQVGEKAVTEGQAQMMPGGSSDYFIETKMTRDEWQSQKMEELLTIMTNADANKDTIAQAKSSYDKLVSQQDNEMTVESLIKALGYQEAVIISKEDRVNVIVQAQKLERKNAVEIMKVVTQHMEVPSKNIVVTYKP